MERVIVMYDAVERLFDQKKIEEVRRRRT